MSLNQNPGYKPGDWNALCDICGCEYKASELRKQWDGFMACPLDFTLRNPQDFVRPVPEKIIPEWTRSDDSQGEQAVAQMVNGVASVITASLTDLMYTYQTATVGVFSLTLPSANSATYGGFSICLTIALIESLSSTYLNITAIAPATGTLVGSQTIVPGTVATFRNYPSQNKWIRER